MHEGTRGAASSAAAVPEHRETNHARITGAAAVQPKQSGAVGSSPNADAMGMHARLVMAKVEIMWAEAAARHTISRTDTQYTTGGAAPGYGTGAGTTDGARPLSGPTQCKHGSPC